MGKSEELEKMFLTLKKSLEEEKRKSAMLEGEKARVVANLKEMGVASRKEAVEKVASLKQDIEKAEKEIEEILANVRAELAKSE